MTFEERLFKRFIIPGVVFELLLVLMCFLPENLNPLYFNVLKHRISGPAGLGVSLTLMPAVIQLYFFLLITLVYTIVLPILYFKKSRHFIPATRTFLMVGNIAMIALLSQAFIMMAPLSASDFRTYINLAGVIPVLLLGCCVLGYFLYWTISIYRHEHLRFLSGKSLKSMGYALMMYVLPPLSILMLFIFL